MINRYPHYYKEFTCIGSACKDNCCFGGWQIDLDEETVEYYKQVPGDFGDKLRSSIDYTDTYCIKQANGRCPFLDTNNLCQIYKELGPAHMGVVCDQFPRFTEYYGSVRETGIGLACEEAARIIMAQDGICAEIEEQSDEDEYIGEYDVALGELLFSLRAKLVEALQCDFKLNIKLITMLRICSKVQEYINNNDYDKLASYIKELNIAKLLSDECSIQENAMSKSTTASSTEDICQYEEQLRRIWWSYLDLESLGDTWNDLSNTAYDKYHKDDSECEYEKYQKAIDRIINQTDYNKKYTNLIYYYLFRYLCKASYDHDILGKLRLAVCNYLIIRDMEASLDMDFMDIIHVFSRQIEYSEDNILELYDSFIFDEAFDIDNLIRTIAII